MATTNIHIWSIIFEYIEYYDKINLIKSSKYFNKLQNHNTYVTITEVDVKDIFVLYPNLVSLECHYCERINIGDLPNLISLKCICCRTVNTDKPVNLTSLECVCCQLVDVTGLINVTSLIITNSEVMHINTLKKLNRLVSINNGSLCLEKLPNLVELCCDFLVVEYIENLVNLTHLSYYGYSDNLNIKKLINLKYLKYFRSHAQVIGIKYLPNLKVVY